MLIAGQPEKQPADDARPVVAWEESPCPLCLGPHWSPLLEAQDPHAGADGLWYAVVQCDSCGTCFTNPRPDPPSIVRLYPPLELHHQPRRGPAWRRLLARGGAAKPAVAWHGEGRLLDIGCGSGAYLRAMQRRGWKVTGLDVSPRMAERVRDELGLPAHAGTLPHLDLEPESFDVITMWHTLEHVHEPLPLLREARKLLAPQGKLVVMVPNIDSWPFRWFGRHWFGLELPRHLTHFTPATLPQMLQRAGFVCEPVRYVLRADWLQASARLACRQPTPPPWQRLLTYRLPAIAATWGCFFAEQSDCLFAVAHR